MIVTSNLHSHLLFHFFGISISLEIWMGFGFLGLGFRIWQIESWDFRVRVGFRICPSLLDTFLQCVLIVHHHRRCRVGEVIHWTSIERHCWVYITYFFWDILCCSFKVMSDILMVSCHIMSVPGKSIRGENAWFDCHVHYVVCLPN